MEFNPAPNQIAHFSINADDVDRARQFYSAVFGWTFQAYGPPGFYMIETVPADAAEVAPKASLQGRREWIEGHRTTGFETTVAVADIGETERRVVDAGGKIVMQRCTLPAIGHWCYFQDPEGTVVGAMQYDSKAE
jgi:predicted enzyme related to lactoylglutathione lyase